VLPDRRLPHGRSAAHQSLPAAREIRIHTVGPVWSSGERGEPELLANCYRSVFGIAREKGIRSLAFPAISCGVYRFPVDRAVKIAVAETVAELISMRRGAEGDFCVLRRRDLQRVPARGGQAVLGFQRMNLCRRVRAIHPFAKGAKGWGTEISCGDKMREMREGQDNRLLPRSLFLKIQRNFRRQRPWRHVVRAAERRQEVIQRVLVGHVDRVRSRSVL